MTYEGYNIDDFNARKFDFGEGSVVGFPGEAGGTIAEICRAGLAKSSDVAAASKAPSTAGHRRIFR
jgi:hypothetical protein